MSHIYAESILLAILMLIGVNVAQECMYDQTRQCFLDLSQTIADSNNYYALCTGTDITEEIVRCIDRLNIASCTDQQTTELDRDQFNTQDALAAKCNVLPTTTTMAPTLPPVACDTVAGWEVANDHIEKCTSMHKTLDKFQYAMQLTKYGICRNVQAVINCMFESEELNSCPAYKQAFGRQLVSYIKLGHLFGCPLKLQRKDVIQRKPTSDCNIWDWLACHDSLFEQLPGLSVISDNTNINTIINYNVPAITTGLASDRNGCGTYAGVNWNSIKRCRAEMESKCNILDVPSRDGLWISVLDLIYELKIGIYDKIYTLMGVEDICSEGCKNLLTRVGQIDTVCKQNAGSKLPSMIMNKFNQGMTISNECSKIAQMNNCLMELKEDCSFMEQAIVFNLHNDNTWTLAFDACKQDINVRSNGRCTAESTTADRILAECSFQSNTNNRANLLNANQHEDLFCFYLQTATNCYAQHVAQCPALERKYWSAELPMMHAANQMITACNVTFQTYGGLKVAAVDRGKCDMTSWVGCLGDLWSALGVTIAGNTLDLAGFKALLALVWNEGDQSTRKKRCSKVRGLNYGGMATCLNSLSMDCQYPMLTVPDTKTYKQLIRDPFNIKDIEEFVSGACRADCTDANVGEKVKGCLNLKNDLTVINTYPKDIIISAYVGLHDKSKCSTLDNIKQCVEYHLDPTKCALYSASLVQTAVYIEAIDVCNNPPTNPEKGPTVGASAATASAILILMSAVLSQIM